MTVDLPVGGLSLQNVTIRDSHQRPWAAFAGECSSVEGASCGAGDVHGDVDVLNPTGAKSCEHALGNNTGPGGVVWIDVDVTCAPA